MHYFVSSNYYLITYFRLSNKIKAEQKENDKSKQVRLVTSVTSTVKIMIKE